MIIQYSFDDQFIHDFKKLDRLANASSLRDLDGIGKQLDINEFSRQFFTIHPQTTADVSIDANANVDKVTVVHYNNEVAKPLHRLNSYFLLWKYARQLFNEQIAYDIIKKQFTKEIYINDFHNFSKPYCFNFSCMDIVCQGLQFTPKKSKPAKNCISFSEHITSFVTYACNQLAGATGLADFLICYAWYAEKLLQEHNESALAHWIIDQQLQGFIYQVNQNFKGSIEAPFCNISIFDKIFLQQLCDEYVFPDGTKVSPHTVWKIQEKFLQEVNRAFREGPLTFPIITACFSIDDTRQIQDRQFLDLVVQQNLDFGFINIYAGKLSSLSSCCRLRSDRRSEFFNSFGSGSTKIGSCGVVTLNLPRLAYESKTPESFLDRVEENVILASRINHVKRHLLNKRIEKGYLPLYTLGFMHLQHQYSTCGINGLYEALNILGFSILDLKGQEFIKQILDRINTVNDTQEKKYSSPHNCEQVPGEASSIKLAEADRLLGYQNEYSFYSNQFIPLTAQADIMDRIVIQGKFDQYMSGGAICHLHFIDRITDPKFMGQLITEAISQGVIYHAINYNIQQCREGHISVGIQKRCPICKKKIIGNFIRVVGFLTDVTQWNRERRTQDYPYRQFYTERDYLEYS